MKLTLSTLGGRAALFSSTGLAAVALTISAPAFAQEADEGQDATDPAGVSEAEASASNAILVTGSRIRRDEYSTTEPLTVITAEEITQSGFASTADALQSTAVTAGSGQINNYYAGFVVDGGTGVNTLGLRGLGPSRTLVLLNGRRLSPAGTRGSVLAADLNVLPSAIVERIEVLKAGASSIYGSDAIAGVVNIITDTKLRGLNISAQVTVPEIGAGFDRRISASFGFDSGPLNIIGSLEYRKRNKISRNDQPWFNCPVGGYLTGEGTEFGSGQGVGFDGSPCFTLDNGGVTINTLGLPTQQGRSRVTGNIGNFNRFVPAPGQGVGNTIDFLGVDFYSRDTFDPAQEEEELVTPAEIYTGFLQANYQLESLGNAELYVEALGTRRKSSNILYRQLSLDYLQGSPLVPAALRNGRFLGPNNTSSGFNVAARAFIGFGNTDASQQVDYVRIGGGIRGDFAFPGWKYDIYVGKSWTDGTYEIESFLIDRVANSLLVTDNGDGTFSCASVASNPNCIAAPVLNADTIGGRLPQAYRDYILQNTVGTTKFRETTAIANFDGPLFALPGGDVQLAVGLEYRKQRIDDTPDDNAISGNLLGLTAAVPTRGTDSVKEAYAELYVPIITQQPFFYDLHFDGSVRLTDYRSYGSDTTYKLSGEWQFVRGFGVRASYGTSYRAPALAEQFLGATSGFIGSGSDPCDSDGFPADPADYSGNQQIIAANCASIGLDVTTFQQNSGITVFNRGGAETGLAAETSRNWSVGVVAQPKLPASLGTLSLAVDYFDIKVSNGVSQLSGATILNRCYSDTAFSPTGGFCRFVERDANNVLQVTSGYVNLATDIVKGYEFNARYSVPLFGGRFVFNGTVTHYTEQSSKTFPEEFLTDSNGITTVPDWTGSFDATYQIDKVTFRYGVDWINGSHGTYDYFAFDNTTGEVDEDLAQIYRDNYQFEVPDYFLHSASVQFDISDDFQFTVGVRNLFDKAPPRISADGFSLVGNSPLYSGYDYTGRTFFANTGFKF